MSFQKIIIDGYNLMYADRRIRRILKGDLEKARHEVIEMIKGYLHAKKVQVTVVFDGRGGMMQAEAVVPGRLQMIFSSSFRSADDLIISTLEKAANPRSYIVVTSDRADIGRTAGKMGARVISSQEFLERLKSGAKGGDGGGEKPDPSEQDVDYWLDKFSEGKEGEERDE